MPSSAFVQGPPCVPAHCHRRERCSDPSTLPASPGLLATGQTHLSAQPPSRDLCWPITRSQEGGGMLSTLDTSGMLLPRVSHPTGPGLHPRLQKQHPRLGRRLHFKGRRGAGNGWPTQPRSKAQAGVIIQRKANSSSQESRERWRSEQSVLDSTAWVNALGGRESPLWSHLALGATTLLSIPSPCHQRVPRERCPKVMGQAVHPGIGCCPPPSAPTQPGHGLQCRMAPGTCPKPWGCSRCSSS